MVTLKMRCVNHNYHSFPHTATQENKQKLFEGGLHENKIIQCPNFISAENLTVWVCSSEGRVIVSVFCPASDHLKIYKPTSDYHNTTDDGSCKSMEVFINGTTGPPEEGSQQIQQSGRRASRVKSHVIRVKSHKTRRQTLGQGFKTNRKSLTGQ